MPVSVVHCCYLLVALILPSARSYWLSGNLSLARSQLAATSVDASASLLIFAGGTVSTSAPFTPTAVVDIFDRNANAWSTTQLSTPRYGLAATRVTGTLGQSALFGGGTDGTDSPSALVDVYEGSAVIIINLLIFFFQFFTAFCFSFLFPSFVRVILFSHCRLVEFLEEDESIHWYAI
jgi:hypothetical protein